MSNLFEHYIEADSFHFKYATGEPELKGEEFHDYDEFVLFLSGDSRLISKNIQLDLSPGTMVLIPKGHFHQFVIQHPESYTRCIFGFRETPELSLLIRSIMTEVKVITSPDEHIVSTFEQMINVVKSNLDDEEKRLFIESSLVQLLIFYKQNPHNAVSSNINIAPEVRQALSYIDKNYSQHLSVESISEALHVSPSTLSHKFSKELNISIYRYISEKRMSAVSRQIEAGKSLADAASSCGFSDYSSFFRMYKRRFGTAPSEKK